MKLRQDRPGRYLVDVDGVTVGMVEKQGSLPSMVCWKAGRYVDGFDGGTHVEWDTIPYATRRAAAESLRQEPDDRV